MLVEMDSHRAPGYWGTSNLRCTFPLTGGSSRGMVEPNRRFRDQGRGHVPVPTRPSLPLSPDDSPRHSLLGLLLLRDLPWVPQIQVQTFQAFLQLHLPPHSPLRASGSTSSTRSSPVMLLTVASSQKPSPKQASVSSSNQGRAQVTWVVLQSPAQARTQKELVETG